MFSGNVLIIVITCSVFDPVIVRGGNITIGKSTAINFVSETRFGGKKQKVPKHTITNKVNLLLFIRINF